MKEAGTLLSACALAFVLTGCSKPQETIIPSEQAKWDSELAPVVKKLSEDEQKLFVAYIARAKVGEVFGGKGIPFGTTVADALNSQRQFVADQKAAEEKAAALKAQVDKERAEVLDRVSKAVVVSLIAKQERPKDYELRRYSEQQVFKIAVKNASEKDIVGVSGRLSFIDVFDKVVGAVTFSISETIKPSGSTIWTGVRDYNEFIAEHRAVWGLEEGKYKTRFEPDTIIFADGTKLTNPKD